MLPPRKAHTLSSSSRARPNSTRSPGTKTDGRLVAAAFDHRFGSPRTVKKTKTEGVAERPARPSCLRHVLCRDGDRPES